MAAVALGALPGCASTPYLSMRPTPGGGRVPRSAIPPEGVFVRVPDTRPVFLRLDPAGRPVALSSRCTHRGCQVEPEGSRLVCPCHGSVYDLEGRVLEGPAERPLAAVSARIDGDDVVLEFQGVER
ncbi:MAG: Rieske (2Fe-2S) protein [Longimicrobiales bacterium]|nr:Rieske (2Fe-2S) protein [Longimicrobiales bacterium]